MKRRNWTSEEKMAIVLEGIRGEVSIAEICRVHQISQNQFYNWRDKFFEGGKQYLSGKKSGEEAYKAEISELQRYIGKQALAIELFKKKLM